MYLITEEFGCETWSLTLRTEHRLRMFENRMLRRIFEPKMDEVTGGWRKLHNEELYNFFTKYNYNDEIKDDEMGRACSMHGGEAKYMLGLGRKTRRKETTRKT
jgi:hypothetical protein